MSQDTSPQQDTLPRHLGVIMDGNRRWAKARGVSTIEGHKQGYQTLMSLLPAVRNLGIPYVTVYAFSTENWSRSKLEVSGLMKLVLWVVRNELKKFIEYGFRIQVVGSVQGLPLNIAAALREAEAATAKCKHLTVGLCFNYGGQQELADAVKNIMAVGKVADDVTPQLIEQYLYASELPPLDLVIRTSGEQRLSGFMLWRAAYAELYFADVLWPDFNEAELTMAMADYAARKRRFGT